MSDIIWPAGYVPGTQSGKPAQDLPTAQHHPKINGHQDGLNGLMQAAREAKTS